jgi:hypothetical protein
MALVARQQCRSVLMVPGFQHPGAARWQRCRLRNHQQRQRCRLGRGGGIAAEERNLSLSAGV